MLQTLINKFKLQHPTYTLIYVHSAGSTLYGTTMPTSDVDYRGIYIPDEYSVLTKTDVEHFSINDKGTNQKNEAGDIDCSFWSIHKFLSILKTGDTNAFDTLFSFNSHANLYSTPEMQKLYDNRIILFPNSLHSFFGYAQTQVKKYSVKGDRLEVALKVKEVVSVLVEEKRLSHRLESIKDKLPSNTFGFFVDFEGKEYYDLLGRKFISTMKIDEFEEKVDSIIKSYGARAKASMDSGSIDFKSTAHAFRVINECEELITTGEIKFPLKNREFLLKIRRQEFGIELFTMLEEEFNRVEAIANSDKNLLKKITTTKKDVDIFLYGLLKEHYNE